ncbi:hypothetical protein CBR_g40342 [Chara braunii]|uniref:Uncharacterized protein n=1 Tax=Chara braunii TaxID=69332 RepID=A0A388LTG7_CHABU|nr:hypothetical protein CBR_g40342 [Chara braunii]|eukprot:GBG85614.1 hypothetical protein CBR_g40342 [Chara braunii]
MSHIPELFAQEHADIRFCSGRNICYSLPCDCVLRDDMLCCTILWHAMLVLKGPYHDGNMIICHSFRAGSVDVLDCAAGQTFAILRCASHFCCAVLCFAVLFCPMPC